MVRVGVIGLGSMGQHHARIYHEMGCLAAVCDTDRERVCKFQDLYRVPLGFADHHLMLGDVDAVSIAVPTTEHYRAAHDFLVNGKHCLIEKPIAFDLLEAMAMVNMANGHCANLAIGHIEHFNPAVLKLKEVIDSGTLGDILIVSTRRVGPYVERIRDVGVVIDSATHDIGVLCYLLGREPCHVWSKTGRVRNVKEDHAIILLDFGGTTGCIEVNWFNPDKVRTLTVTGTKGTASLDYIAQTLTVQGQSIPVVKQEPLKLELQDFIESIEQHRPPRVDGRQGLDILRIALSACKVGA